MAFLNIVSLPKKIDEIRHSMSDKSIDIIAFNETRLDSSFTDNLIHLDGYDIIRKDRSRNGVAFAYICVVQSIKKFDLN